VLKLIETFSQCLEKIVALYIGEADNVCRERKGDMKPNGLCNAGFEMPTSEIAAFHLHRSSQLNDNNLG